MATTSPCGTCASSSRAPLPPRRYTLCDLARLSVVEAAAPTSTSRGAPADAPIPRIWLAAYGKVYAVPREWAARVHPGGPRSIESRPGLVCDKDFDFHSAPAQGKWRAFVAGTLEPCERWTPPPSSCDIS